MMIFFFQLRKVLSHAFRLFADKMHKAGATVLILRKVDTLESEMGQDKTKLCLYFSIGLFTRVSVLSQAISSPIISVSLES